MRSPSLVVIPATLLAILGQAIADQAAAGPTAIKKLSFDANEKLLPEHLAFARLSEVSLNDPQYLPLEDQSSSDNDSPRLLQRAFALHYDESHESMLRRAAEVLAILERRQSCPGGTTSCADIGSPNKCCQEGTYCQAVPDTDVGQVACCPQGSDCGGGVGNCPSDAVTCPASLGGGCCISGYICQGVGCVLEGATTRTQTAVQTSTEEASSETITTIQTTIVEGEASTVVVTLTVTRRPSVEPTTRTTTEEVTISETESDTSIVTNTETEIQTENETQTETETGGAPFRPTISSEISTSTEGSDTQTGCPTGFYGCLATHGGGCCRTDRNCETQSCPAPSSTTLVSDGRTIVAPATDLPASATSTCADGWSLCGDSGGPIAGCCPSGFSCGTASCFTVQASETASVQKEQPESNALVVGSSSLLLTWIALALMVI